jgi:DNA-binding SARP family transcriptional activator
MDSQTQLALLLRVNSVLHSTSTVEQIMGELIQEVISTLQAQRGFVVVLRDQEWVVLASHHMEPEHDPEWIYSRTVVRNVAESGEPVVTSDAMADGRYCEIGSVTMQSLHSILCAPLRWDGQVRGVVYADHNLRHGIFQDSHLQVMKAIADQASRTLEMAALHQQLQRIHQQHASPAATVDYLVQSLSQAERPPLPGGEQPEQGLAIRLFGPFQVFRDGARLYQWSTRKNRDLLAYLAACHGQVVAEDRLVDLFWGQGGKSGVHSLHNGITQLRKQLGKDSIVRSFDGYQLAPQVWIDADQFGRSWREGRRAAPESALQALSRADGLVEGEFLEGFQAEWVEALRARWRDEVLQCRSLLADHFARHGKHLLAVEIWKRVLLFDNCSEEGYRGLFQAYRSLGRQADALRLFQSCVQNYSQELDLPPPEEFERLAHF